MSKRTPPIFKEGDYVLATRWPRGDSLDAWCVGVYSMAAKSNCPLFPIAHHVLYRHPEGDIREGVFRRVQKISEKRGAFIVKNRSAIMRSLKGLWWWARCNMKKNDYSAWFERKSPDESRCVR